MRRHIPSANDHTIEDVFDAKYGVTGYADEDENLIINREPIMQEVAYLEEAKRNAVEKTSRISSKLTEKDSHYRLQLALESEQAVIDSRVDLINRFITDMDDPGEAESTRLCFEANTHDYTERLCVKYTRLRCEDGKTVYPIQNARSWATAGELQWKDLHVLGKHHPAPLADGMQSFLQTLVASAVSSAVLDETTEKLRGFHWTHGILEKLVFTQADAAGGTKAVWQHGDTLHHTVRTYTASSDTYLINNQPVLVQVLFGPMVINHCDQWQNPLINAYVRECVVKAGLEAMHGMAGETETEASEAFMHIFLKPVIRIQHGGSIHVLSLSPYLKPDSCTLQHITMMDCADEGVINMYNQEVSQVQPSVITSVMPMKYYHCTGTRPNTRFNEQELNFLHSKSLHYGKGAGNRAVDTGIIAKIKKYYDQEESEQEDEEEANDEGVQEDEEGVQEQEKQESDSGRHVLAKSFRISFSEWDVLVSSYSLPMPADDQEDVEKWIGSKTVISLYNYPPPGVRYLKNVDAESTVAPAYRHNTNYRGGGRGGGARHARGGYRGREARPLPNHDSRPSPSTHPFFIRWVMRKDETVFPFKIYTIDFDSFEKTDEMRRNYDRIRYETSQAFRGGEWLEPAHGQSGNAFMYNLEHNENTVGGETIYDIYRRLWAEALKKFCGEAHGPGKPYAYIDSVEHLSLWEDILGDEEKARQYSAYSQGRFTNDTLQRTLVSQVPSARLQIAPRGADSKAQECIQQMRARIQSLEESKRVDAEHEGNKEHVLQQILQRLGGVSGRQRDLVEGGTSVRLQRLEGGESSVRAENQRDLVEGGSSVKAPRYDREITADHGEQRGPARTSLAAFGSSGRSSGGSRRLHRV